MTQYTNFADIIVSCPQEELREIIKHEFHYSAYKITWFSPVGGFAYQGSRSANLLSGLLPYYEISFQIHPSPDKTYVIRLIKSFKGIQWRGRRYLEYLRIDQKFIDMANRLSAHFYYKGWLERTMFF